MVKAILKDLAPSVVSNYRFYSRPDPEYDAERQARGYPPIQRMGPEKAILTPEQYQQLRSQVIQKINR